MQLTQLNIYPAKSMQGIGLESSIVTAFGLHNDRRWMLVDDDGLFLTQRKYARMCLVSVTPTEVGAIFTAPEMDPLIVSIDQLIEGKRVKVWRDEVSALWARAVVSRWFEKLLGVSAHLVYMPETAFRQVDRDYFPEDQRVSFADGFPFLLISEASLSDLNGRLKSPVPMNRFRPNIVVSGCEPYAEDSWKQIRIGGIIFDVVKPCSRCVMTTVDAANGSKGQEPLRTLTEYRKNEFGVCFGQNLVHRNVGELHLGDRLEILA